MPKYYSIYTNLQELNQNIFLGSQDEYIWVRSCTSKLGQKRLPLSHQLLEPKWLIQLRAKGCESDVVNTSAWCADVVLCVREREREFLSMCHWKYHFDMPTTTLEMSTINLDNME